jgi:hypothetical protein
MNQYDFNTSPQTFVLKLKHNLFCLNFCCLLFSLIKIKILTNFSITKNKKKILKLKHFSISLIAFKIVNININLIQI